MHGSAAETENGSHTLERKPENTGDRKLMANGGSLTEQKVTNTYN